MSLLSPVCRLSFLRFLSPVSRPLPPVSVSRLLLSSPVSHLQSLVSHLPSLRIPSSIFRLRLLSPVSWLSSLCLPSPVFYSRPPSSGSSFVTPLSAGHRRRHSWLTPGGRSHDRSFDAGCCVLPANSRVCRTECGLLRSLAFTCSLY